MNQAIQVSCPACGQVVSVSMSSIQVRREIGTAYLSVHLTAAFPHHICPESAPEPQDSPGGASFTMATP